METMIDQGTIALATKMGAIAFLGAVAHALNQHRTGGAKDIKAICILGVISFFFGITTGLVLLHVVGDKPLLYGLVGVAGWLGIEMSSILTDLLKKILQR